MTPQRILEELALFADVATNPRLTSAPHGFQVEITQHGERVLFAFSSSDGRGQIVEQRNGTSTKFSDYRSLLASSNFGSVQLLARLQSGLLRDRFERKDFLRISGEIISGSETKNIDLETVDTALSSITKSGLRVMLLDGPAGIGKTHLISRLVFSRASSYRPGARPPILHIESRGRVMTWLPDRIASTLQDFRSLTLTYEQLPVLVRHGLIQVAIDGFDELADPAGYEQSWASLRAFLQSCIGEGALILAGRDTFLGAERLHQALIWLDSQSLTIARLRSVDPRDARAWLTRRDWSQEKLKLADHWGLFDPESYVLRPYFLAQLAKTALQESDYDTFARYPLSFLVELFVRREAEKLGGVIELNVTRDQLENATRAFYKEVARTMADYETETLDLSTLQLIASVAYETTLRGDDLQRVLHRVESIALLESGEEGSRRFAHSEIQNFFLSGALIDLLGQSETPKSVIRNVFGTDLLRTFAFTVSAVPDERLRAFFLGVSTLLRGRSGTERAARNLGCLYLAASHMAILIDDPRLTNLSLDDAVMVGVAGALTLQFVTINQLDVRGANLGRVLFNSCQIASLIGDETTVLPEDFPMPSFAEVVQNGQQVPLFDTQQIGEWVADRQGKPVLVDDHKIDRTHPLAVLIDRVCRTMLRQYWIRNLENDRAARLLDNSNWPTLEGIFTKHDLLRKEPSRAASGKVSYFFHIKRAREILARSISDGQLADFWKDVASIATAMGEVRN